jgi:hypothetical protein
MKRYYAGCALTRPPFTCRRRHRDRLQLAVRGIDTRKHRSPAASDL